MTGLEPESINDNHASRATPQDDRKLKICGFRTFWAHVAILRSTHGQQFIPRRAARQVFARYALINLEARKTHHPILNLASSLASY